MAAAVCKPICLFRLRFKRLALLHHSAIIFTIVFVTLFTILSCFLSFCLVVQ